MLYIALDETDDFAMPVYINNFSKVPMQEWSDHREDISDAGHIWIAAIGPDTKAKGIVKTNVPLYQKQIAPTMAALLNFHFVPDQGMVDPIKSIFF